MWCLAHGGGKGETALLTAALYKKAQWQKRRAIELSKQPLCVACLAKGKVTAGDSVDHIFPHRRDAQRFIKNRYQVLCRACHTAKTVLEKQGKYVDFVNNKTYTDADYLNGDSGDSGDTNLQRHFAQ
jgi:hypothetical protein